MKRRVENMRYGRDGEKFLVRPITEDVSKVIESLGTKEFTVRQVAEGMPYFQRHIKQVIRDKARQGVLDRVRRGVYRRRGRITSMLPMGVAADAVWAVLIGVQELRSSREIAREAEKLINRPERDCRGAIQKALYAWVRLGHVERHGELDGYEYRVKPGTRERPPLRRP